jgi:hypothetical protein
LINSQAPLPGVYHTGQIKQKRKDQIDPESFVDDLRAGKHPMTESK